ncbi:hypothetical protein [Vibrio breoganii]|uniref:hypothetical protein n=1 Tax=Vibrio breoganii TaxID=553239 RepID=UPI000C84A13D|nr:hypothetical protein [Vibrio breoganii]PMO34300.1 hypothetical protein BCT12_14485 [Vibrio breoganii]
MRNFVFLVALATSFITTSVLASDGTTYAGSEEWGTDNSTLYFWGYDSGEYRGVSIFIAHSSIGEQRLYIEHMVSDENTCTPHSDISTSVVSFNGQPVKFTTFCKQFSDSKKWYQSMTPETENGANFVFNAFKNASATVSVKISAYTFDATAKGFTRAWNSAGGNAL